MEREIKFRAYRPSRKTWVYGVFANRDKSLPQNTFHMSKFWELVEENILTNVGQFITKLGSFLKDIYEDDIVRWMAEDGECYKGVVTFKELDEESIFISGFIITNIIPITDEVTNNDGSLKSGWNGDIEVIGNRFDNPELLQ